MNPGPLFVGIFMFITGIFFIGAGRRSRELARELTDRKYARLRTKLTGFVL